MLCVNYAPVDDGIGDLYWSRDEWIDLVQSDEFPSGPTSLRRRHRKRVLLFERMPSSSAVLITAEGGVPVVSRPFSAAASPLGVGECSLRPSST